MISRSSKLLALFVGLLCAAAACSGEPPSTTETPTSVSATTTVAPTSSVTAGPANTTRGGTTTDLGVATAPFSVPVGDSGVTYDLMGGYRAGPSSFTILGDGSVVIADTMALRLGQPRLLWFDRVGVSLEPTVLMDQEVASIVDVTTDGGQLALLDVYAAKARYRVLVLDKSGAVKDVIEIPLGFRLRTA